MNRPALEDVYFFMYYDEEEKEISVSIAESLEEFKAVSDAFDIIAWCNVTGKEMEVGNINVQDVIKILSVEGKEEAPGKHVKLKTEIREDKEEENDEGTGT